MKLVSIKNGAILSVYRDVQNGMMNAVGTNNWNTIGKIVYREIDDLVFQAKNHIYFEVRDLIWKNDDKIS